MGEIGITEKVQVMGWMVSYSINEHEARGTREKKSNAKKKKKFEI